MKAVWRVELRESLQAFAVFATVDVIAKSASEAAIKAAKVSFQSLGLQATKVKLVAVAK